MLTTLVFLAQLLIPVKPSQATQPYVVPPRTGSVALKSYALTLVGTAPANGDNDGYADAGETNDLALTLINKTGQNLTNVVATLTTADGTIECISPYQVTIPSVAAGATFTTPAFRFKVADAPTVARTDVDQVLDARFQVAIHSDQFDLLARPMRITLSLDLDTSSNSGLGTWFEDFENPSGLGKFAPQSLDAGKNSLARSDGMRCQYNNPGGVNSNSAGNSECFLGFTSDPPLGVNDWHLHDSSASNGGVGRAYSGSKSMHWGVHLGTTPKRDTTRFKQLDAAKSGIINVPAASAHPELSFAQQVSFVDNRGLPNGDAGESADRGVVEVNVLQASGADGPLWRKIYPYVNEYDEQGTDNFYNCTFDPTDDGNNEDDFFDPSDPNRRLGPSSTCKPEYTFACQGDTDYHLNDVPPKLCNAEGPGYKSADAVGSWVVPVFNLQDFAGRRIKIRFLATSIELGVSQTWDSYFGRDDIVADDGWYIDAVKISPVANLAMTVTPDTKSITTLPCAACTSIQAAMTATPGATPEPGVPVALDASASAVDFCKIEPPQYTFWIDENDNGVAGDAGDTLLRTAADDPHLLLAPVATGKIAVVVSCRTEPLCDAADGSNTAEAMVTVNCPAGIDRTAFGQTIALDKPYPGSNDVILSWAVATRVDIVKGNLSGTSLPLTLRGTGSFTGTLLCMTGDSEPIATFDDFLYGEPYPPSPGDGYYYLVRGRVPACGQKLTGYSTNTASESSGRDAEIAADPDTCP